MKYFLSLLVCLLSYALFRKCSAEDERCYYTEYVSFRGVKFPYPLSAQSLLKIPTGIVYNGDRQISADSIAPGLAVRWFCKPTSRKYHDSLTNLNGAFVYGASFYLYGERNKTDKELMDELRKTFPGKYKYTKRYGEKYWVNQQCKTIIFSREWFSDEMPGVPVVSFCYGLLDSEIENYATSIGNTYLRD